jgi:enoyl-CoA hydratase/carnithine racemase
MTLALDDALAALAADTSVRVVVLTAAGERAFSAGGDMKERASMTAEQFADHHHQVEAVIGRLRSFPKPIFTAVNGVAAGGGCEIALSTDFVIASRGARFGQPEVRRGIIPGCGGTQLLGRFVPRGRALQMLMTGELIDADEALRLGLVNEVCEPDGLRDRAIAIASQIAANSPNAVREARAAMREGSHQPIEEAIRTELAHYARVIDHPDRYEGMAAFNEKRDPVFADPA